MASPASHSGQHNYIVAGLQGHGLSNDGSTGIWPAATNLCTNGGFETNTTGWAAAVGTETLTRQSTTCKFGSDEMEHERLAGPRALTFGCLGGIIFWGLLLFGIASGAFAATYRLFIPAVAHGGGPQYQACAYTPRLPIALHIGPGVDAQAWRWALDDWQRHYPGTFVESPTSGAGIVEIVADTALWVDMPCEGREARIHSNSHGGSLAYWAPHELGHVLALRDLIRADTANPEKYINPGRCPSADYNGIMSYCASILDWWGADDDRMIRAIAAQ